MHRFLRILSTTLVTAGIVVLLDVGLTLVWQEPLSTVYGSIQQGKAED
jgi:sortase A